MRFVFCHGFGFNNHFWDNLAPYFIKEKCTFIDLGYFKKPSPTIALHEEKIVGIGHSLGLLKLIGLYKKFECIVGLNSFTNFLGNNHILQKRRQLELKILAQHFKKNPINTLRAFYERCGTPKFIHHCNPSDLDVDLILSDIEFLSGNNNLPSIPALILASNDDIVVPKQITEDNFAIYPNITLNIINHAQHGLGFIKPLDVYERIMSFVDDRFIK